MKRHLLTNTLFLLYDLLSNKILSITDLMSRACNNVGGMLASDYMHYEIIISYLLGECDEYDKKYDSVTSNYKNCKIMEILTDKMNVWYKQHKLIEDDIENS